LPPEAVPATQVGAASTLAESKNFGQVPETQNCTAPVFVAAATAAKERGKPHSMGKSWGEVGDVIVIVGAGQEGVAGVGGGESA
jgi:hypothetical protein